MDAVQLEIQKQEILARLKKLVSKQDKILACAHEKDVVAHKMKACGFITDAAFARGRAQRKRADARKLNPEISTLREWMRREILREKRRSVR
jgi:hypothetical protein